MSRVLAADQREYVAEKSKLEAVAVAGNGGSHRFVKGTERETRKSKVCRVVIHRITV